MLKDEFTCNERCKIFWGCMNVYTKNESSYVLPIIFILLLVFFGGAMYAEKWSLGFGNDFDGYIGIGLNAITLLFHLSLTIPKKKLPKLT